jgi:hypothetical protein
MQPLCRHRSQTVSDVFGSAKPLNPAVIDQRRLRWYAAQLAIGCLVARYLSWSAAEHPGPDFPWLLWEADHELGRRAYQWLGQPPPDAPQHNRRPRSQLTQKELDLADVVKAIPNDADWHNWNRVGMAIWHESKGSDEGAVIFDDWSAKSPKYNPYVTADRWKRYHRSPPSKLKGGTLIYLAREAGWRPRKPADER